MQEARKVARAKKKDRRKNCGDQSERGMKPEIWGGGKPVLDDTSGLGGM